MRRQRDALAGARNGHGRARGGNEGPKSASASATPTRAPVTDSLAPAATTIVTGSPYSGSVSSLAADDGSRYQVDQYSYSYWSTATPAAYVSPSGEIRYDVPATRGGGSFRTRSDLVAFTVIY